MLMPKLVAGATVRRWRHAMATSAGPNQCAAVCADGAAHLARSSRLVLDANPEALLVRTDIANAFNTLRRSWTHLCLLECNEDLSCESWLAALDS